MAGESDLFHNRQVLPNCVKGGELRCFLEPFKPKVLRVNSVFLKKCWLYAATAQDDFKVDAKYTFEIGGRSKGFSQIADVDNSYVLLMTGTCLLAQNYLSGCFDSYIEARSIV